MEKRPLHGNSRGLIVELNHADNSTRVVQSYVSPDGVSAESQGNAQVLPDGNVFVNWGQSGAVTEFRADGTPIFHAALDTDGPVQNYRGFRSEWTGRPREVPAVAAVKSDDEVSVFVSWNGDTEVALWRFYSQDGDKAEATTVRGLGKAERTSFETSLTVPAKELKYLGDKARIFAAGFAKDGTVLTRSRAVAIRQDVNLDDDEEFGEL